MQTTTLTRRATLGALFGTAAGAVLARPTEAAPVRARPADGPLTCPHVAEETATLPTEPDALDAGYVLFFARRRLEEAGGALDGPPIPTVAAVAQAAWNDAQAYRRTPYDRALHALPAPWPAVLAVDRAALDLVEEAVAFGARMGFALAMHAEASENDGEWVRRAYLTAEGEDAPVREPRE
jgi:hypothetical protein